MTLKKKEFILFTFILFINIFRPKAIFHFPLMEISRMD